MIGICLEDLKLQRISIDAINEDITIYQTGKGY